MIFKCGSNELIYCYSIILPVLLYIKTEIKILIIHIIANDFNGFNTLCFRKLFVFFEFFCIFNPFPWLSLTKDRSHWFHNEILLNLSRIILL